MSKAIVLEAQTGQHLGFLLLAGGPDAGECIFRSLPMGPGAFDLPESKHVETLKSHGECQWRTTGGAMVITAPDGKIVGEFRDGSLTTGPFTLVAFGAGDKQ